MSKYFLYTIAWVFYWRPKITNEEYTMLQEFAEFIGKYYQGSPEEIEGWKQMLNEWNRKGMRKK